MTYDIHPIVVHFPIAMLILYSLMTLLPFQKWMPNISWKHIERALLLIGFAGAVVAGGTGETAEHLMRPNHALVEMHSLFAGAATWIYGVLLLGECIAVGRRYIERYIRWNPLKRILFRLGALLERRGVAFILSGVGLIAISVTGILGGVLVYGTSKDPFALILLNLLGIHL